MIARIRFLGLAFAAALLSSCAQSGQPGSADELLEQAQKALPELEGLLPGSGALTGTEIAAGLREALKVGTGRVVQQVGRKDGFNGDKIIRIPLPGALKDVQKTLRKVGLSRLADDLELRLNRAAEAAAPEAKALFVDAITQMTLKDVRRIYEGPDDAATRYFQGKMTPALARRMQPVIDRNLAKVGAIAAYDRMISRYKAIPLVPDVKADLTEYVADEAMDGLFHYVAVEEAAIRNDPAKRTTEILKRVFGSR